MSDAYTYDPKKNPRGGYIPGVPLADLSQAFVAAQPAHIQASIEQAAFYIRVQARAPETTAAAAAKTTKTAKGGKTKDRQA